MRESVIEKAVCKAAEKNGWLVIKLLSQLQKGLPDRMFLKDGKVLFIEFKAPGKKPTKLQGYIHKKFGEVGHKVYVIDNIEEGSTYLLKNGYTGLFKGFLRLNIGRYGEIAAAEEAIEEVNTEVDMSAEEHEREYRPRRSYGGDRGGGYGGGGYGGRDRRDGGGYGGRDRRGGGYRRDRRRRY